MCLDAANRDVPYYVSFGYHGISPDFYPTLILDLQIIGHELDHENLDNEDSDIISNTEEGRSLSIVDDSLLDGTPEARYITCHSSEIVSYLQEWIEQQ